MMNVSGQRKDQMRKIVLPFLQIFVVVFAFYGILVIGDGDTYLGVVLFALSLISLGLAIMLGRLPSSRRRIPNEPQEVRSVRRGWRVEV